MQSSPKPLVIVADDDPYILKLMEFHLKKWGYRAACAPDKATLLEELSVELPALLLLDLRFGEYDGVEVLRDLLRANSNLNIAMLTAHGSIDTAVSAIKQGAYEYLTKPPDLNRLQLVVSHAVEKHRMAQKIAQLERIVGGQSPTRPLWGDSPSMQRIRELIASVAPTDATVLILGESGTGKELVARAIHEQSPRLLESFIPVNMAAMPRELMESTLFGHEKGAFTGADQVQRGCCEAADKGTLFLDEIAELDIDLQAKLLRFLQERTVQRVGSSKIISVNVRILAATNCDPQEQVRAGRLREDLYYRLNVVPISMPPLRERREDIEVLATLFLQRAAARNKKELSGFSSEAVEILMNYHWPGNVRQLENLVERLAIFNRGTEITGEAIPPEIRAAASPRTESMFIPAPVGATAPTPTAVGVGGSASSGQTIDQLEKQAIVNALARAAGNVGEAARALGLGQATVYRKIKRYGIVPKDHAN